MLYEMSWCSSQARGKLPHTVNRTCSRSNSHIWMNHRLLEQRMLFKLNSFSKFLYFLKKYKKPTMWREGAARAGLCTPYVIITDFYIQGGFKFQGYRIWSLTITIEWMGLVIRSVILEKGLEKARSFCRLSKLSIFESCGA